MKLPEVGRDAGGKLGADIVEELGPERLLGQRVCELGPHLVRRQLERLFELGIFRAERIGIGNVSILQDEGGDALGRLDRQPRADGRAEVVQPKREAFETERLDEAVEEGGISIETVVEVIGCGAVAGAWKIGCNQPPFVREPRHQLAKFVGRAGITVRQQHDRRIRRPGFAIENLDAVEVHRLVADRIHHDLSPMLVIVRRRR